MKVVSIASSSKGNAYVVEHDGAAILIDCGVAYKNFKNFSIDAILITHSHTDHVQGLKTFLKYRDVPIYANSMTAETIVVDEKVDPEAFVCFENGQEFEIGPFTVHPFSIPHDSSDPVGYQIKVRDSHGDVVTYFHATDVGTPLDSIGRYLAEADIATIESNHDPVMLRTSKRPFCLIQRIAGPRGHLANEDAADLVKRFASPRLKTLNLAHLSEACNTPDLAEETMRAALKAIAREDVELKVFSP